MYPSCSARNQKLWLPLQVNQCRHSKQCKDQSPANRSTEVRGWDHLETVWTTLGRDWDTKMRIRTTAQVWYVSIQFQNCEICWDTIWSLCKAYCAPLVLFFLYSFKQWMVWMRVQRNNTAEDGGVRFWTTKVSDWWTTLVCIRILHAKYCLIIHSRSTLSNNQTQTTQTSWALMNIELAE